MHPAAEILQFPHYADGNGGRATRGGEAEPFAPFVDPGEAERALAQGQPGDELQLFLRRSLDRLGQSVPTSPMDTPWTGPTAAPAREEASVLPPEHPAYEAPRPQSDHGQATYGVQRGHGLHPAYVEQSGPQSPSYAAPQAEQRQPPSVAGAPESGAATFDIPSFLRARPGIPQSAPLRHADTAPASMVQPVPAAPPRPARSRGAAGTAAGELLWVYSVFPAILLLQVLAGIVWEPLASYAATVAFLSYAALWASDRPVLFQLRVAAGSQFMATAAVFLHLDTASPEQWMHMFAVFAATAIVLAAMGGIEIYSRIKGR